MNLYHFFREAFCFNWQKSQRKQLKSFQKQLFTKQNTTLKEQFLVKAHNYNKKN